MHLLISGIPASGKSTFCKWLEEKKGFLHLDVEKPGVLDRYELATAWATLFDVSTSAAPFVQALDRFKRPVVIDWGFPPECLNTVRKLSEGGVMLWWFAADWAVARRKFKERGTLPVGLFDIQIRKIEAALPEINALFGSHVEYALPSTGIYTPPNNIWKSMIDTLAGPPENARAACPRPPLNHQETALLSAISPQIPRRIRDPHLLTNPRPSLAKSATQAHAATPLVPDPENPVPDSEQASSKS